MSAAARESGQWSTDRYGFHSDLLKRMKRRKQSFVRAGTGNQPPFPFDGRPVLLASASQFVGIGQHHNLRSPLDDALLEIRLLRTRLT